MPHKPDHSALLVEIRDRYRYFEDRWREIRDERQIDLRYVAGDPWSAADRKARTEDGRPCINHDELGQFVNQAVNSVRQNKRGIRVSPAGNGATDESAEFRQNLIRTIEYDSQAQGAYISAFQNMLEGSYGFFRISRKYVSDRSFDQKIVIKNIANPDSVLYDPDCKEADWSDAQSVFVLEPLSKEEFRRRWPKAEVKDFTGEHEVLAKGWIQDKIVLTAEYWRVEIEPVTLCLLATGAVVTEDEVPEGTPVVRTRRGEQRTVVQYITNGLEILEANPQPGEHIPIIPAMGLERYVDDGTGTKRKLFSLVRLARDPQMSLAYLCSQQMEEAGLTPKTPYIGYVGQFETDSDAWAQVTRTPHAFLQVDPIVDAGNTQILPLPQRQPFTPNFAGYEVAKDSARRAIQAAMGIMPMPTAAQRQNEKSGVALEHIRQQQNVGSFHFIDNFDRSLAYAGRVIESWIPAVYDTERELALRKPDDSHQMVTINTAAPYVDPRTKQEQHFPIEDADHDVTVGSGPSYESQREAAGEFLDSLIGNLGKLPLTPPQAQKLFALAIQMKQLGPKGDQMAEIISPPEQQQELPPQVQAILAQAQQQLQLAQAYAKELEQKIAGFEAEKQAKVIDNEYKLELERMKIEAQVTMAEITTKAQNLNERIQFVEDVWKQLQGQHHEAETQALTRAHEVGTMAAEQAQQHALAERTEAQQQALASQQQAHEQQQAAQQQQAAAATAQSSQ